MTAAVALPAKVESGSSVAVIGGGMLGLTLALRLAERGSHVTLFERAANFGGLADAWTVGDVTWDRHYHVTLYSDTTLRALLADLGLEHEVRWTSVGTGFYTGGRFYPMNNAIDFLRFPPLGLIDKLRLGLTIFGASRITDPAPLEEISVERWLTKRSGRKTFEKIWRPLLLAKLGDRYRDTSAAFIWAIIVRLYAARRAGLGAERFGYVPGGYARVIAALESRLRSLGVRLVPGAMVTRVTHVASAEAGGETTVEFADESSERFDRAILTVPAPVAAALVPALEPGERDRLSSKIYGGIICASLVVDEPLGPYYVTNLTDEWVPFSAVIDMGNVVDRAAWGGRSLAYLPKYVRPDDPLFDASDAEIEQTFVAALERLYPRFARERVRAFRISRVRHVFPIATLGYSKRIPSIATSVPGVFVLNSTHIVNGTLNVNETLGLVERGLAALGEVRAATIA